MKQTLLILLFITTLFASCSKDDDNDEVFKWDIINKNIIKLQDGSKEQIVDEQKSTKDMTDKEAVKLITQNSNIPQEYLISDEINKSGDVKTRVITYAYPANISRKEYIIIDLELVKWK